MQVNTSHLVGVYEIAQKCGVSSQAVSNWHYRHDDFPHPVLSLRSGPLFLWQEVHAWLVSTGRASINKRGKN